jgi:LysM repeat protein
MAHLGHHVQRARRLSPWCVVLLLVLALTACGEERTYVVKRNDTLYGLARRNRISVSQLADRNGLSSDARLFIGQHLVIPSKSAPQATSQPTLDKSIQKAIDIAHVKPRRWRYIVLHHSGVEEGTVKSMDRYHREVRHMEHGLAYHFVIGNGHGMRDGEIAVCPRWREQLDGGHLHSEAQNKISIGICLVGNFDKHKPTPKQLQSLNLLVEALLKRCKLSTSAVKTHRQINTVKTRCPGKYFPIKTVLRALRKKP